MENLKRNPLFHSISSQSTNKFRSIMNSPNYGNQQILLQSCCFFESDKSQTPHASRAILKEFKPRKKNKSGSPKLSLSNRNLNTFKKYNFSENNIEENTDLIINDKQLIITKLKKHNKALKETIKNLTSQLDRVCRIALKAKNNEMNTIQKNNDNEQEKNILLDKIENLKKEKNNLELEIVKKDEEYKHYKLNNKINEINNHNKIKNQNNYNNKFNLKYVNTSINEEKFSQENLSFKNKLDEQINSTNENDSREENINLTNKLIESEKKISENKEKFDGLSKKYNNIIGVLKKSKNDNKNLNTVFDRVFLHHNFRYILLINENLLPLNIH